MTTVPTANAPATSIVGAAIRKLAFGDRKITISISE